MTEYELLSILLGMWIGANIILHSVFIANMTDDLANTYPACVPHSRYLSFDEWRAKRDQGPSLWFAVKHIAVSWIETKYLPILTVMCWIFFSLVTG